MPMMHVGVVGMAVSQRLVRMRVRVRLTAVPGKVVRVLMMFIMNVEVRMRQTLVRVFVLVPLG